MTPRQFSTSIAKRTPKALAIAALALGISASVFTPSVALAAPPQDGLPDLVTGALYFKGIAVAEVATIPAIVKNNGSTAAIVTDVWINIGPGLGLLAVEPVANDSWRCSTPLRSNADGSTNIECTSSVALQPGQFKEIGLRVHGETHQDASKFYVITKADPDHRLPESNEDNNATINNY